MAPWGKQRDSETNKNASSESLSTTPNDDVNDDEQHERTKMNEQNQRSHSVAKAEMGEKTQPWTKQEDLKLQHMQEKYGNKWATVASQLPGRTGQQCAQRWRHRVNPNIRREKWTKEEDEKVILMMFVLSFSRFKNHRHLSRESREIRRFERRKRETSLSSTSERSRGVETSVLCKRDRVNLLYFSFSRFATKTIISSSRCHHEKSERGDERQLRSTSRSSQRNKKPFGRFVTFFNQKFFITAFNTLSLAICSGIICAYIALLINFSMRFAPNQAINKLSFLLSIGYVIPGLILAVGLVQLYLYLDNSILQSSKFFLTGSLVGLVLAYIIKTYASANSSIESGYERLSKSLDNSARVLGAGSWTLLRKIHMPLLKTSLFTSILLVMSDVVKELPATLILRPFNFDTLAVSTYLYAAEERMHQAAAPAIAIVVVGLIPIILLTKMIRESRVSVKNDN